MVSSILVFEEDGNVVQYAGGYSDWAKRGKKLLEKETPDDSPLDLNQTQEPELLSTETLEPAKSNNKKPAQKLSYKYQRELNLLPEIIENLEAEISVLSEKTLAADFYEQDFEVTQPILKKLAEQQSELAEKEARWIEREEMKS